MIRVTVELISAVHPSRNQVLGIAEICNDREKTEATGGRQGDYLIRLDDDDQPLETYTIKLSKRQPKEKETWKRGRVEGFDRRRLGAWDLLFLALKAIVGGRNK